ncbi:MAG: carbon storage regulator [Acidobacteria bacterium]|nr:carbon storage regulator [Acidobacteriota bacterium]
MLVIRRRAGESILIGEGIEIQVAEISGGRVKLGIVAPAEVTILRKEVKLTREQNLAAARGISLGQLAELAAQVGRGRGA